MKQLEKGLSGFAQVAMQLRGVMGADELKDDWLAAVADRAFIGDDALPRTAKDYKAQKQRARTRLPAVREAAGRLFGAIAAEYHAAALRLAALPPALKRVAADVKAQLASLVYPGAFSATPWDQLQHLPRYLKAMTVRLDKYVHDPERDVRHAAAIAELWKLWQERGGRLRKAGGSEPRLEDFRWQIEELRTPSPVSVKRLKKIWDAIAA